MNAGTAVDQQVSCINISNIIIIRCAGNVEVQNVKWNEKKLEWKMQECKYQQDDPAGVENKKDPQQPKRHIKYNNNKQQQESRADTGVSTRQSRHMAIMNFDSSAAIECLICAATW